MLKNIAKQWVPPHAMGTQSAISAVNCWADVCKGTCKEAISALVLAFLSTNEGTGGQTTLPLSTCTGGGEEKGLPVAGDFLQLMQFSR